MKIDLNINFLISKISTSASADRKIFGGTYKTLFFFTGIDDYFQIYGNGLYQAVGRDNEHTYFKTWNNSSFAGVEPQDIFKQLGSHINRIEIYGCGNEYKKVFSSFKLFLDWINVNPADADIQIFDAPEAPKEEKEKISEEKNEEKKSVVVLGDQSPSTDDKKDTAPTDTADKKDSDDKNPADKEIATDKKTDTEPKEEQKSQDPTPVKKPVVIIDNNVQTTDNP